MWCVYDPIPTLLPYQPHPPPFICHGTFILPVTFICVIVVVVVAAVVLLLVVVVYQITISAASILVGALACDRV